ncbi:MAG: winged helix-turn-helix transcriptional regulator [Haloarculaceae archaeon]
MSEVRGRLHDYVVANPGVHFSELRRELDIATGQAQHHLRKLTGDGEVVAEDVRGRTHYFEPGFDPWQRRAVALARRETTRALLIHLLDDGPLTAAEITDRLDVARSTVSWHVSSLVDAAVVEKSYVEDGRVELSLVRPDETQRVLRAVQPSLSDRLVDRFTRLVDDGLSGREGDSPD